MTPSNGPSRRRDFLRASAASVAIGGLPVAVQARTAAEPVALEQYKPEFLTPEEWAFILAATARLIPSEGDGPGALETRVPVFIDRQLSGDYGRGDDWYMQGPHDPTAEPARGWQTPLGPAQVYRQGIAAFDGWCEQRWGKRFAALETGQQDEALTALQKGEPKLAPELSPFFATLLANTKEGYFADPIHGGNHRMQAWVYIGFPGARASFHEWVDQPNVRYPLGPVSISGERA